LRQITLAKTQLKNKWSNESTSVLQRGQERSDAIEGMIDCRRALVGRMFQTIFHKNSLKRSFKFSFQIAFHKGRVGGDKLVIKMARYAEFVVKQPEQEWVHKNLACCLLLTTWFGHHTLKDKISLMKEKKQQA
jgi:hypothetical protein